MWNQPRTMLFVSDALFVAGALLLGGALVQGLMRLPVLPLREVVVVTPLQEVQKQEIEQALGGALRGNLLTVPLDATRAMLERLPWVRHADVRRRWPGTLEVRLEEHQPAARWGDGAQQLVNRQGEVFFAAGGGLRDLPVFNGPTGSAPEVLARYAEFGEVLAPTGRKIAQVNLTPRLAWQVRLDDGVWLELGREQAKSPLRERLGRFAAVHAGSVAGRQPKPVAVDLRYPNGFVLKTTAPSMTPASEARGNT